MKCDIRGLLLRAAEHIEGDPSGDFRGYAFALRELAKHAEQVRTGTATLEEFAEFYSFAPEPSRIK